MSAAKVPVPVQRRLLDYPHLAAYLSVSVRQAKTLGGPNGVIPRVEIGAKVLFDVADVDAWIERKKKSA